MGGCTRQWSSGQLLIVERKVIHSEGLFALLFDGVAVDQLSSFNAYIVHFRQQCIGAMKQYVDAHIPVPVKC